MQSSNWTVSHRSPSYLLLKWRYSIKYICVLFLKNPSLSGFVNEPPGPCLYKTFLQHYREVVKWFLTRQKNTHRAARRERGCVRALPFYFWRRLYAELSESVSRNIDLFHDVLRLTAPDTLLAVRKAERGWNLLERNVGKYLQLINRRPCWLEVPVPVELSHGNMCENCFSIFTHVVAACGIILTYDCLIQSYCDQQ